MQVLSNILLYPIQKSRLLIIKELIDNLGLKTYFQKKKCQSISLNLRDIYFFIYICLCIANCCLEKCSWFYFYSCFVIDFFLILLKKKCDTANFLGSEQVTCEFPRCKE